MIRTADRMGHITEEDSFQNNLLEKIYGSVAGRMLIRPLVTPVVSIAMGKLLDSRLSAAAVKPFIRFNHLDMSDYEKRKYISYNDFFKRKIREGARHIDMEPGHFISPCDCRVSVYPVDEKARLHIKQTEYTIEELLRNPSLGKDIRVAMGGCFVSAFRIITDIFIRTMRRSPDASGSRGSCIQSTPWPTMPIRSTRKTAESILF